MKRSKARKKKAGSKMRTRSVAKRKQARIRKPARKARKVVRHVPRKVIRRAAKSMIRRPAVQLQKEAQAALMPRPKAAVLAQANVIVTFDPNKPSSARAEVERVLHDIGETARIEESRIPGIFKVALANPKSAIRKLVEVCRNSPERFNRTFHWTPIDRWCHTNVNEMQNIVRELAQEIRNQESWKISIEKRQCNEHERDLVTKLTSVIDKSNVNLSDPDKILKVDILGNETGLAVLGRDEFLNVSKFRR